MKNCENCGIEYQETSKQQKYCESCKKLVLAEQKYQYFLRKKKKPEVLTCKLCKKEFRKEKAQDKYCSACKKYYGPYQNLERSKKYYYTKRLYRLLELGYPLTDSKVIKASEMLDKLVVEEQIKRAALQSYPSQKAE